MSSIETADDPTGTAGVGSCSVLGPVSGDLLRRLGEAERGYDDGNPHWFVTLLEADGGEFDVHPCFSGEEAAHVFAKLAGTKKYAIFGPFVSRKSIVRPMPHPAPRPRGDDEQPSVAAEGPSSAGRRRMTGAQVAQAPETSLGVPAPLPALVGEVARVTQVIVRWEQGANSGELKIDGKEYDALFWGTTSVNKFVIPYYASANSLDYAIKVYNDFFVDGAYLLAHAPDTEYKAFQAGARGSDKMLSPII